MGTNPPLASDASVAAAEAPAQPRPVAPVWHTVVFLIVIAAVSFVGARGHGQAVQRQGRETTYLLTIAWEWALVLYISWGVKKRGSSLRDLVGGRWKSPEDFLIDVSIAVGFWLIAVCVLALAAYAANLVDIRNLERARHTVEVIKPVGTMEMVTFLGVALTAGFCEEVMFRGYLMRQIAAWTHVELIAVLAQALCFGVAHGYQGPRLMFVITVFGMLFGVLAAMRRSLRPGMIAHAMQDSLAGLVRNIPMR